MGDVETHATYNSRRLKMPMPRIFFKNLAKGSLSSQRHFTDKTKKCGSGKLIALGKSQSHPFSMVSWSRPYLLYNKLFHTQILTSTICASHNTSSNPIPQPPICASHNTALAPFSQPPTCVSHNTSLTPFLQTPTCASHKISTVESVKLLID